MQTDALFEEVAADLIAGDAHVAFGTMMGSRCLRYDGAFLAMLHVKTGELIVKLSAARVAEHVRAGRGQTFAPNGRVFKEWMAVPEPDRVAWTDLLEEARSFAAGSDG